MFCLFSLLILGDTQEIALQMVCDGLVGIYSPLATRT